MRLNKLFKSINILTVLIVIFCGLITVFVFSLWSSSFSLLSKTESEAVDLPNQVDSADQVNSGFEIFTQKAYGFEFAYNRGDIFRETKYMHSKYGVNLGMTVPYWEISLTGSDYFMNLKLWDQEIIDKSTTNQFSTLNTDELNSKPKLHGVKPSYIRDNSAFYQHPTLPFWLELKLAVGPEKMPEGFKLFQQSFMFTNPNHNQSLDSGKKVSIFDYELEIPLVWDLKKFTDEQAEGGVVDYMVIRKIDKDIEQVVSELTVDAINAKLESLEKTLDTINLGDNQYQNIELCYEAYGKGHGIYSECEEHYFVQIVPEETVHFEVIDNPEYLGFDDNQVYLDIMASIKVAE